MPVEQGREEIEAIQRAVNGQEEGAGAGEGEGRGESRGKMEVHVMDGIGHVLVKEMVPMVADWVWKWALEKHVEVDQEKARI